MKFTTRLAVALAAALFLLAPAHAQQVLRSQTVSFDNYAALKAVPFARFQNGAAVIIADDKRGGMFIKDTTDRSVATGDSLVTSDAAECVFIPSPQDATGASGGYIREEYVKTPGIVYTGWCGAALDANPTAGTGTDDTTILNQIIAGVNAGAFTDWRHNGNARISNSAALTAIVADDWTLRGDGGGAGFYKTSAATSGAFLEIGTEGSNAKSFRWEISDLTFEVHASAAISANDYTIDVNYANTCAINRIRGVNTGAVFRKNWGGLCHYREWDFTPLVGANADGVIDLYDIAVETFDQIVVSAVNVTSNTNATGAMIRLNSTPCTVYCPHGSNDGSIDTLRIVNSDFQLFNSGSGGGKPYGLLFNRVNGSGNSSLTNIWWINSYIDHTSVAAVYDVTGANTASQSDSRLVIFDEFRFSTDSGDGFVFDHSTTGANDRTDFFIGKGKVTIQDDSQALLITGSQDFRNSHVSGLHVSNRIAVAKTKAVSVNAEGWRIAGVYIDEDGSGVSPTPFTTGVVIESAGLTDTFVYEPVTCGAFGCTTAVSASASQYIQGGGGFAAGVATTKTVASGTIALAGETFIEVAGEGAAADTLDTITGASNGDLLLVEVDAATPITFTNNSGATGSMWLGEDIYLDGATDKLLMVYNGTKWNLLSAWSTFRPKVTAWGKDVKTVASGVLAVAGSYVEADTEGAPGATTDTVDCISGGQVGDVVIITQADNGRDLTFTDSFGSCAGGTAQLRLAGALVFTSLQDTLVILKTSASTWVELSRSDNL